MSEDPIKELRQQIDQIDTSIINLLHQRTLIVERLREKKDPHQLRVHPSREVSILRGLLQHDISPFPKNALIRIWRELISVLAALQKPFSIAVYVSDPQISLWDIARDYYGSTIEMYALWSMKEVFTMVRENRVDIGVLPYPTLENVVEPWWQWMPQEGMPKVISRLPFYDYGNARAKRDALSIAAIVLEERR